MKRKILAQKFLTFALTASVTATMFPTSAFAVTDSQVAADGTYSSTAHVTRTEEDTDDEWDEYDVNVKLTVKDGKHLKMDMIQTMTSISIRHITNQKV